MRGRLNLTVRTALLAWLVALVTIAIFAGAVVPEQKRTFLDHLQSKARGVTVSLRDVAASAVVNGDYSSVVDHCVEMLNGDTELQYIVFTRNDGFSLVHDRTGWRIEELPPAWRPTDRTIQTGIGLKPPFGQRVFNLSQPFDYSGVEWGWLHLGLSVEAYDQNVSNLYRHTAALILASALIALVASILYARHLVRPILQLDAVVRRMTAGDFSARATTNRGDEVGQLAASFNSMADALLRRDRKLNEANELLERRVSDRTADLARALEAAEQASRAKSAFVANISHEIRTPLNGVLGMCQLLMGTSQTAEQREYTATIASSGDTLLGLINEILDFSKLEANRMELEVIPFSLPQLLKRVAALFAPSAAEKNLALQSSCEPAVARAYLGDPVRLQQVLANLVSNAIKFTAAGRVAVSIRAVAGGAAGRQRLEFAVQDSGIGIRETDRARLFQPFSQVDSSITRRFGGTGLGLSICRRLIDLMGGQIDAESTPGQGSRFFFRIDLAPAPESPDATELDPAPHQRAQPADRPPPPAATEEPAPPVERWRVLVAEDNIVNQQVARRLLARAGCVVDVVADGAAACAAVQQHQYDLVFMDCHMPVLDGLSATRRIREWEQRADRKRLPVIALTASTSEADRAECLAAGMDDYLSKPVQLQRLTTVLQRYSPTPPEPAPAH